jgi:hypothetical protein
MEKSAADTVLEGYVKIAQAALKSEYGKNYTQEDLTKLSMVLIAQDQQAAMEKEAEFAVFSSFADELSKQGVDPIPVLTELDKVLSA